MTTDHPMLPSSGPSAKPFFVLGGVLLLIGVGALVGMTIVLVGAGMNAEPGAEGIIPGQSVLGPVAVLIVVTLVGFTGAIFSIMIGAKRMMRGGQSRDERERRAAA